MRVTKINEKQNVLHLVEYLYLGGIERLLEQLASNSKHKENLFFFTYESKSLSGIGKRIEELGFPVYHLKKRDGRDLSVLWKLNEIIRRHQINVIHTHDFGPMEYAVMAKIMKPSIRLIHTQHTLHHFVTNYKYKCFYQVASFFYHRVICVSMYVKSEIEKHCPFVANNVEVIPNGVNTSLFTMHKQIEGNEKILKLVSIARISPEKNIFYLLKTCMYLKNWGIPFQFYHAGSGEEVEINKVNTFIKKYSLENHIKLFGFCSNVNKILDGCEVFVSASKTEGHPISVLEAMASGKVCFCSNIPAHREISNEYINYFNIVDSESLARKLADYYYNRLKYSSQQIMARNLVINKFSLEQMVKNYEQQYQ